MNISWPKIALLTAFPLAFTRNGLASILGFMIYMALEAEYLHSKMFMNKVNSVSISASDKGNIYSVRVKCTNQGLFNT